MMLGKHLLLGCTFCVVASAASLNPAYSDPLTIAHAFNFLDTIGVNPIGSGARIGTSAYYSGYTRDHVRADITPNAGPSSSGPAILTSGGTSATATQGPYTVDLLYSNSNAFPNQFGREISLGLTGPWTITATNAGSTPSSISAVTPALAVSTTPPPDTGITISGNTLAPTISWTTPTTVLPSGTTLTQTVFLFAQQSQGSGAYWSSGVLPSTATSVQVGPNKSSKFLPPLKSGQVYSVSIQTELRDSTTGNLEARTRQFTGYVAASATPISAPVLLPDVSPGAGPSGQAVYQFNSSVSQGVPILLDPLVATGFIFGIGQGNPNYAGVSLPNIGNPTDYNVCIGTNFGTCSSLGANTWLDFDTQFNISGGVSTFEVLGIDPNLALDPNNATDFVASVKFTADGNFTGTMTPITTDVPEPPTWAMMLFGLVSIGFVSYRQRKRTPATAIPA